MSVCRRCGKPFDDHECHDGGGFICDDKQFAGSKEFYPQGRRIAVQWVSFEDEKPPFDQRVLIRGELHELAVAFNNCYPPNVAMTVICGDKYTSMDFEPTHWMKIPEDEFF